MLHRRICGITENEKYVLQHKFSDIITQKDNHEKGDFITDMYNPFILTNQDQVFATEKHLPEAKVEFSMKSIS